MSQRSAAEVGSYDRGYASGYAAGDAANAAPGVRPEDMEAVCRGMGSTRDTAFYAGFEAGFRAAVAPSIESAGIPMPRPGYDPRGRGRYEPVGGE